MSSNNKLEAIYPNLLRHLSYNPAVTTFMYDDQAPSLPVPPLEQTMKKYVIDSMLCIN